MNLRDFRGAGHTPTLLTAFLYFDVSFMIWLLPGAGQLDRCPTSGFPTRRRGSWSLFRSSAGRFCGSAWGCSRTASVQGRRRFLACR